MVAKPLYPLYKNIIKPLDRVRYPELRYNRDALSYVKTLKVKGGKPIPADENSLDALVEKKYSLL